MNKSPEFTLQEKNKRLEELRVSFNEQKFSKESYILAVSELQTLYTSVIMGDLEASVRRQLENFLWNDCFKGPLSKLTKTDKEMFNYIIETGIGFYLGFIQDIGLQFDVPFIRNAVHTMFCTNPRMKPVVESNFSRPTVYYIIQNSLVHLGDLLRYGGSYNEAFKMYEKSTSLAPSNGHPHNQMGLVQILLDSKSAISLFYGIYHYVRAVSAANPFLPAQNNLDGLVDKIKTVIVTSKLDEFIVQFIRHVMNLKGSNSNLNFLDGFSAMLTKDGMEYPDLLRMLVIALWAWRKEADQAAQGQSSEDHAEGEALELIASLINGMTAAVGETNFLIIGSLSILLSWLQVNPAVTANARFREKLDLPALCAYMSRAMTLEGEFQIPDGFDHVILPEEKRLLGFPPVSKAFEHYTTVIDEMDGLIFALRLNHFLCTARSISGQDRKFIKLERDVFIPLAFEQPASRPISVSVSKGPNRRNVALQSIFNMTQPQNETTTTTPKHFLSPSSLAVSRPDSQNKTTAAATASRNESSPGAQAHLTPDSAMAMGMPPSHDHDISGLFQGLSLGVLPSISGGGIGSEEGRQLRDKGAVTPAESVYSDGPGPQLFRSIWTPMDPDTGAWK